MKASPNNDPGIPPEVLRFTSKNLQYIKNYTVELQAAALDYGPDTAVCQDVIESIVESHVAAARSSSAAQSEALALVVVAEGLGATRNQHRQAGLMDILDQNRLIDRQDQTVLRGLVYDTQSMRDNRIPDEDIASIVATQVGGTVSYLSLLQNPGKEQGALQIALLGFYTGATLKFSHYDASEKLLQKIREYENAHYTD